jgi:hypothetical protein
MSLTSIHRNQTRMETILANTSGMQISSGNVAATGYLLDTRTRVMSFSLPLVLTERRYDSTHE